MKVVLWAEGARRSRNEALDYIFQDSPNAATSQLEHIRTQTRLLAEHPHIGRPGRIRGTRELVIRHTPFIAVYRVTENAVQIVRFLHGAQNH
ncbi:type II toxin-antitoxin system RelE/ParE family toxin [Asticcacaulis sp. AND118]|uniref:type II toxin-antitoxin system RelE/ParE family toxin n=1 Tax=Asticcacaulis sp. AND118 TaxID=2840468 RepID=UPI001D00106B|nr:type II toxin-antitoxin system RelE/ParE family toxin [Asticcacaulis sp. AND118]UDF05526.1 type II toxin-antitoxin system RelE/ParE family toxin [Asticcacaulis sp. AND118]